MKCEVTGQKGQKKDLYFSGLYCQSTYLEVAVDHAHLVAVEHSL